MNRINLIPAARLVKAQAARRRRVWLRFLRVYMVFAAIGAGACFLPMYAAGPSLDQELERINRRIEASTTARDKLQKEVIDLTRRIEAAKAVGEHADWSLLLDAVARRRGEGIAAVVFDSAELTLLSEEKDPKSAGGTTASPPSQAKPGAAKKPERETFVLKVSGVCRTPDDALEFVHRVEELGLFDRVNLKDTRAQALGHMPATHFEIEMFLAALAPAPAASSTPGGK